MHNPEKTNLYLKAKSAYYFGTPIMSDVQFDKLEEDLRNEDPTNPALALVGAPIPTNQQLQPAAHSMPMGSQEKVDTYEELQRWLKLRTGDNEDAPIFHVSLKADGGSLGTYYENGQLRQGITRGSGTLGEDITASTILFKNIPAVLPFDLTLSVRCEALLTRSDWKRLDPELESNPRSIGNGVLGQLDGKEAHFMSALAFDIQEPANIASAYGLNLTTESGKCKAMEALGFTCSPWKGGLTLKQVQEFYEETLKNRDQLDFWADGVVVKYDLIDTQEELGVSSGRPKGQVAWKFPPEGAWTKLLEVFWQVGHTGAITPVAIVEPIRIGGTTVSRASLANVDNIKLLKAFIGAEVYVIRAGDVIPQIVEVKDTFDESLGHKKIEAPATCPVCEKALENRKNVTGTDSVVIFCTNPECEAKTLGKIKRFCTSRNILGIGDSIIESLVNAKIVVSVPDLYRVTPDQMENLDMGKGVRVGRKRAEGICKEVVDKAIKMSLPEFLGAFGTRSLGVRRATLMIQANPELEDFEKWFDGSLLERGFAHHAGVPQMGAPIYEGLKERETTIRETLTFVELTPFESPAALPEGGKTFCITGSLPSGKKKKEYAPELEAIGCKLVDDLNKYVNFLVLSDPNGPESSKTKKAKKLGIPLMSEEDLVAFIKAGASTAPETPKLSFAEFAKETMKNDPDFIPVEEIPPTQGELL